MLTKNKISEIREILVPIKLASKSIGFVPTMGALHQGHLSLVEIAKTKTDFVVMSIFVNPLQFNSAEDLEKYPRLIEQDTELAQNSGVDLLFTPTVDEIILTSEMPGRVKVIAGSRSVGLCGASRPGHFDGVVSILSMLFNITQADVAVFGEKDYQQLQVVRQLVKDLHYNIKVISGPTVREQDGLALSSRNLRLSAEDRYFALYISKSLFKAQEMVRAGETSVEKLKISIMENLERSGGLKVEYVEIVDVDSLESLTLIDKTAQLLVAAYVGNVRLIDNIRLDVSGEQ